MKWTREDVQLLTKKVYGNFMDESLLGKVEEMHVHLEKWDKAFLGPRARHEWAEVERLANEINSHVAKSVRYKA